jgi:DNA-binding CsgD family transcriptional regulator/tetratricopeptide (TPR) repeat protein
MTVRVRSARLVGRTLELARLDEARQEAAAGVPAAVVIGGEAGVGKSRLVQEFVARAREQGARTLAGACIQLSRGGLPYGPIVEALRGLPRLLGPAALRELLGPPHDELVRLVPGLEPPAPGELERRAGRFGQVRLFEQLLRLLGRLGEPAPVVVVVEDLHWADASTRDLLAFLARNLRSERVVLVATYRTDDLHTGHPLPALLAELDRNRRVEHLQLARFDREELAELLGGILGMPPAPETVQRIFSQSEGNAFFTEELVAAGNGRARGPLPPRLQGLLLARAATLTDDARHVLRVAATIGRKATHDLLASASQLAEPRLLAAIREAIDRQLLVAEDDTYWFRHVLLQEAVYGDLLPGERRRLHAVVARALAMNTSAGVPPEAAAELSHHWHAARRSPQALTASIAAARAAVDIHGFTEAHHQYERACTLWEQVPDAPERTGMTLSDLRLKAAEAARWAGRPSRGATLLQATLADLGAQVDPVHEGLVLAQLAECQSEAGEAKAALVAYEEASRLVAGRPPSAGKARILAGHGTELMRQAQYSASRTICEQAIATARAADALAEEGRALNTLGCDLAVLGDPEAGVAALRQALRLSEAAGNLDDLQRAYYNLGVLLRCDAGRPHEALQVIQCGLEMLRDVGLELSTHSSLLRIELATHLWDLGRWQEAEALIGEELTRELSGFWAFHLQVVAGRVQLGRGRLDLAREHYETAVRMVEQLSDPLSDAALHGYLAELAMAEGDYPTAQSAVARAIQALADSEQHADTIRICGLGLRAAADAAERAHDRPAAPSVAPDIEATGSQLLATARRLLARVGTRNPEARAQLASCEAEFMRLQRRSDPGQWAALADSWDALAQPLQVSYARWRQAEAMLTSKASKAAAAGVLRQGHRAASELGARPLQHEIERLARRARIDLQAQSPKPDQAEASTPAARLGLTPREREVLQHLVEGRTNRQIARALFISEKTASVHVSNIMTKLGAANRLEAAAIAHRLRLADADSMPRSDPGPPGG